MATYLLGVDIGGTFTDLVLIEVESGRTWVDKVPSTPTDPSRGLFNGLDRILAAAGASRRQLAYLFHGSTVATNAILEGKGAVAGFLTTQGTRHVLEIGRHDIPRVANMYSWVKPQRPVTPDRIAEVPERMDKDGNVVRPLDEAAAHAAVRSLVDRGVDAIAVCLLHAYANPAHEQRLAAIAREVAPELPVSLSSEILPVFREYERAMATVLNAYLVPKVARYLDGLRQGAAERDLAAHCLIMKADGGVFSLSDAAREPIHMVTSGPAAGVVGALFSGQTAGLSNLISLDMGGTSTDVCLINRGTPEVTTEGSIGTFPVPIPMLDIHTIGAGGGSLAAVTAGGGLSVGPQSAGALPGPACYGRGGTQPTVTDANLVLGRLPASLLGGDMTMDLAAARQAVQMHVALPLGLSLEAAADGILEIANNHMVGAVRVISVERGFDPRDFTLVSFGGAGGLHAGRLATLAGIRRVLVPPRAGVLCALGLLGSDLKNSYARTCLQKPPHFDYAGIARVFGELTERAHAWLDENAIPAASRQIRWTADLRYARQGYEIEVETTPSGDTPAVVAGLVERFHLRHEQLYRYQAPDTPVELVNLRVHASGRLLTLQAPRSSGGASLAGALVERRPVYFAEVGWVDCPCYERDRLPQALAFEGPAIIQQHDATTVLYPGHRAESDAFGNLLMTVP